MDQPVRYIPASVLARIKSLFENNLIYLKVVSGVKISCPEFTSRARFASKYYLSVESKTPSWSLPARSVTSKELQNMFRGPAITMFRDTAKFGEALTATRPITRSSLLQEHHLHRPDIILR